MKLSLSYKNIDSPKPVEMVGNRHIRKLEALLKHYAPDLVQLRGHFTRQLRRNQFTFSVNLSLPTGGLNAVGEGPDPKVCAREAFTELEAQINLRTKYPLMMTLERRNNP